MAVRQISEYLASGEPVDLVLSNNITYTAVSDPAYENMFLRVGPNGHTALYRAPDQDIVWTDTDNTNISLTTTLVDVLSITPTEDLDPSDTSYRVTGSLDNTSNQTRTVTITVKVDTVEQNSVDIELSGSEVGKAFLLNGIVSNIIPAGSVIDIAFSEASNDRVLLRGDLTVTTITVTKAQAAPVAAITAQNVQDHDYKLNLTTTTNLGPKLSRAEIETVIVTSGYPLPTDTVSFSISDASRDFAVTYNVDQDKYVYVVLEEAT